MYGAMDAVEALKMRGYGVGSPPTNPKVWPKTCCGVLAFRVHCLLGRQIRLWSKADPEHLFTARRAGGIAALTCLVGDTATDRNTAKAAGVPSIL
jgi:phosphoglycolate phosphatase